MIHLGDVPYDSLVGVEVKKRHGRLCKITSKIDDYPIIYAVKFEDGSKLDLKDKAVLDMDQSYTRPVIHCFYRLDDNQGKEFDDLGSGPRSLIRFLNSLKTDPHVFHEEYSSLFNEEIPFELREELQGSLF